MDENSMCTDVYVHALSPPPNVQSGQIRIVSDKIDRIRLRHNHRSKRSSVVRSGPTRDDVAALLLLDLVLERRQVGAELLGSSLQGL